MPTVGQWPPRNNRPRSARYGASSAPPFVEGEAVTMPVASSYAISCSPPRSITSASERTDHCAQLCPPERTATCQPRDARQTYGVHHLRLGLRAYDGRGLPVGQPAVEDPVDPGLLEAGVTATRERQSIRRAPPVRAASGP